MSRLDNIEPWHYLVVDEDGNNLFHPFACKTPEAPCCCKTTPYVNTAHVDIREPQKGFLRFKCGCSDCDPDRYLVCMECTFGNCSVCEWPGWCGYSCLVDELLGESQFREEPGAYWVQAWSARDYWGEYDNGFTVEEETDRPDLTLENQGIDYDYEFDKSDEVW